MRKQLVVILLCNFAVSLRSDGSLDTTFGTSGYRIGQSMFLANGVAVQDNGGIIVTGVNQYSVFTVLRLTTNGTFDLAFGSNGVGSGPLGIPFDVLIQPDGNILIAGQDNAGNFQITRFLSGGFQDYSYGSGGGTVGPSGFCSRMGMQIDGKVVAAGGDGSGNVFLVRYTQNGSIDTTYSIGPLGYAEDIKIQEDGKAVIAGPDNGGNFQLVRYNTDGTWDSSFGTGGVVTGPSGIATSLLLQSDGYLVVGGCDLSIPNNIQLARFTTSGTLDSSFGTSGIVTGSQGIISDMVLQSDGKIVILSTNNNQMQLIRYTASGILDLSFGISGMATPLPGLFLGLASQSSGNLILVGLDKTSTQAQVARFTDAQSITDTTIIGPLISGTGTVTFDGNAQNPSNVYLYLDGSFIGGTVTDTLGSNTWSYPINLPVAGEYLVRAVSLHKDGKRNSASTQMVHVYG
jgi:uncharacterized delta-60 repeat protein